MASQPLAELSREQVVRDGLRPMLTARSLRAATVALGVLSLLGAAAFVLRLRDGFDDRTAWGYYAAMFSFLLAAAGSAPMVAIGLRMTGADWRRPLVRACELLAVVGVLLLLLFIPLLLLVPGAQGRDTIWLGWPGAPHLYDALALAGLVACGLLLLYASALPDFATFRDALPPGPKKPLAARLAGGWQGTARQWRLQRASLSLLGAFYLLLLLLVQILVAADFAESLVPGWRDPLFPLQQAVVGVQTGLAVAIVLMAVLRRAGYRAYVGVDHFWSAGKILLALSLLWFYFWFSGIIVMWYGRMPIERNLLNLLWFGPYLPLFIATFVLNFLGPFLILIWNRLRRSIAWPLAVSVMIVAGTFLERTRFYVASYSVQQTGRALERVPTAHFPDIIDVLMVAGGLAAAILVCLAATRVVPVISVWEIGEGILLRTGHVLGKLQMRVIAKED